MRQLHAVLVAVALLLATPQVAMADHLPRPKGYVNDFAKVLSSAEEGSLERELREYEQGSGNEIAVALVEDLDDGDIDDFTARAFEEWKVGKKGEDNGVLLLAAIDDRKVRIEVGYGVEGDLTDGEAGNIIRNAVVPAFRDGDYARGVEEATGAIRTELGGRSAAAAREPEEHGDGSGGLVAWMFGSFIAFNYIGAFLGRTRSIWAGGLLGGIGGLVAAAFLGGGALYFAFPAVLVLFGLGLDWLLSRNYQRNHRRGFRNSRGGFFSGFGGGSSGGSSFGGFGGGSSGGGGASGGW